MIHLLQLSKNYPKIIQKFPKKLKKQVKNAAKYQKKRKIFFKPLVGNKALHMILDSPKVSQHPRQCFKVRQIHWGWKSFCLGVIGKSDFVIWFNLNHLIPAQICQQNSQLTCLIVVWKKTLLVGFFHIIKLANFEAFR